MTKILLIGDSSIERFPKQLIEEQNISVINAGIKNIKTSQIYELLPKIFNKVKNVHYTLLQIGLTDILSSNNINNIMEEVKKIICDISKRDTSLVVLPVYPTCNNTLNYKITEYNYKLEELCYELNIEFLEIYELLLNEQNLLKDTYTDNGTDLNAKGFSLIANQITEYIRIIEINYSKK